MHAIPANLARFLPVVDVVVCLRHVGRLGGGLLDGRADPLPVGAPLAARSSSLSCRVRSLSRSSRACE